MARVRSCDRWSLLGTRRFFSISLFLSCGRRSSSFVYTRESAGASSHRTQTTRGTAFLTLPPEVGSKLTVVKVAPHVAAVDTEVVPGWRRRVFNAPLSKTRMEARGWGACGFNLCFHLRTESNLHFLRVVFQDIPWMSWVFPGRPARRRRAQAAHRPARPPGAAPLHADRLQASDNGAHSSKEKRAVRKTNAE